MPSHIRKMTFGAVAGAAILCAGIVVAGPERVTFPDYHDASFTQYDSVDRELNPRQIGNLFANDVALSGLRDSGELPIGSVLVMELHDARIGADEQPALDAEGRRISEGVAVVAVMEKCEGCGEEYPPELRNGNWEYAFFDPETGELIDRDYSGCFACHKPLEDQDFVFSIDSLRAAAGQ